jgi:hypothetical protein
MVSSSFIEGITIEREGMFSLYSILPNKYFDANNHQELINPEICFSYYCPQQDERNKSQKRNVREKKMISTNKIYKASEN